MAHFTDAHGIVGIVGVCTTQVELVEIYIGEVFVRKGVGLNRARPEKQSADEGQGVAYRVRVGGIQGKLGLCADGSRP